MYFDLTLRFFDFIGEKNVEHFIDNNDVIGLFGKQDEKSILILRGLESDVIGMSGNKKNADYQRIVRKYKEKFLPAFLENPYKYFDSYILRDFFINRIFSFSERRKIKKILKDIKKQVEFVLEEGPKNKYEKRLLMKYLKDHININDKKQKKLIKDILEKNEEPSDYYERMFLCSFVSKWMLKENGFEDEVAVFPAVLEEKTISGYAFSNIILIKNDREGNISNVIESVCHETQHVIQDKKTRKLRSDEHDYEESEIGFIRLEHKIFGSAFYKMNYFLSRIEYDAEVNGIKFAEKFFESFGLQMPDYLENFAFKGHVCDFVMAYIGNDKYEKEFAEYAYASYWDDIVSRNINPNTNYGILSTYPCLKKIYNEDGSRKSFKEMISSGFYTEEDFYMFYSFVFCYIQEGALDNLEIENDEVFYNINLVCQKVNDKIKLFAKDGYGSLLSLPMGDSKGFDLSSDDVKDVYKSEMFYYTSFLLKIYNYLNNHLDKSDERYNTLYIKELEKTIDSIRYSFTKFKYQLDGDDYKKIKEKNGELLSLYNDSRRDEIKKQYMGMLKDIVTPEDYDLIVNVGGKQYKLSDYVCDELYKYTNFSDISTLDIDGNRIYFDNYIVSLIAKAKGFDDIIDDIVSLSDMLKRDYYNSNNVREDMISCFNKLIIYYDSLDKNYADVLRRILARTIQFYQEDKFKYTPIDLNLSSFSKEIKEVMDRCRK